MRVAVPTGGAVAHREHFGQGRAAVCIDCYAICPFRPCFQQRRDCRLDPDTGNDHVRWDDVSVRQPDASDNATIAVDAGDLHARADIDAMRPMFRLVEPGNRAPGNPGQDPSLRFKHRDVLAQL